MLLKINLKLLARPDTFAENIENNWQRAQSQRNKAK